MTNKIERFDLDAQGKPCSEGYAVDSRSCLVLMPPTAAMAAGLRLATQADVDKGGCRQAQVEDCAES